jgi:hypothetical protein
MQWHIHSCGTCVKMIEQNQPLERSEALYAALLVLVVKEPTLSQHGVEAPTFLHPVTS